MSLSDQIFVTYIVVGICIGLISWLAVANRSGSALILNLIAGLIGSLGGGALLPMLGIYIGAAGAPLTAIIINATVGAIVTVLLVRLVTRTSAKG